MSFCSESYCWALRYRDGAQRIVLVYASCGREKGGQAASPYSFEEHWARHANSSRLAVNEVANAECGNDSSSSLPVLPGEASIH